MTMRALGLAFAVWTAAAGTAIAQAAVPLVDSVPSITVDGTAKRDVTPDLATVTLGVTTDRPNPADAESDNAKAATAVLAAAKQAGVADEDLQTSELRLFSMADQHDATKIKSYRASNQITIRTHDLHKLGSIVAQVVSAGSNSLEGIEFSLQHPEAVLDSLRAEAVSDAARKATIYAEAAGMKLGRILRILPESGGGRSMPAPMRVFKTQAAVMAPPVEAGSESLESNVQIVWELLPRS